ncbi:DNA repair protein RecN [Methylophilaceae bacterium]|nr:DNA repair protein RecN [Methylophilaceae bacterium]
MLESLVIKNFVIVDHLELNFLSGFSSLTGETGAGKSILIDALSICLGQRAGTDLIRKGEDKSDITSTFTIDNNAQAISWMHENAIDHDGSLIVRRIINIDGKSKAFINGTPSSVSQLKELSEFLVDIYSQNSHHSLLKPSTQKEILDSFARSQNLASEVKNAYLVWVALLKEYEAFAKNRETFINELEELEEKYKDFNALNFSLDGWEQLKAEHKVLNNSAELIAGTQQCLDLLDNTDKSSINEKILTLKNYLSSLTKLDVKLAGKVTTLEGSALELLELSRDLNHYLHSLEVNEGEKRDVESRVESTFNFLRKYKITPEELDELSAQWRDRIEVLSSLLNESDNRDKVDEAKRSYDLLADKLSSERKEAGLKLSIQITDKLNELSFKNAQFQVKFSRCEPSSNGNEYIEFLIATFLGAELRPIQKVASGGELSRISLAIRVSSITDVDVPTMIFDEVDVGIGGSVAEIVGKLLKALSHKNNRQTFVITHLPQVAAQSDNHFRVSKKLTEDQTSSDIKLLSKEERVTEIARMLGGVEITQTTIEHAKEILG